ncbi:MAG TPA: class I SAM-dependent methyltransferase [Pirellulales bacterium]|jgi:ubiquinone/menaquinone biosynthesis C-methylase UbiE|nr:class I SAM-dependent methyltransferase [Pirellulales bacterium]
MISRRVCHVSRPTSPWARFATVILALLGVSPWRPQHVLAADAPIPPGLVEYKGRAIAPYMTFHGADWLTRDSREKEEHCKTLLKALNLRSGATVCDMGCGNGYYTLKIAKLVGKTGRVLAVDIQPEMLHLLDLRAKEAGVANVEPIQGTVVDPKLPDGQVDLILLVDVYHEFSHPEQMLVAMRKSLKPRGRLALVEFRLEDPSVPIKLEHKMSKDQIMKEFTPNGFKLVEEFEKLPWQHVMFFEATEGPQGEAKEASGR